MRSPAEHAVGHAFDRQRIAGQPIGPSSKPDLFVAKIADGHYFREYLPSQESKLSILDAFQQPRVVDQGEADALDQVALTTIEQLRQSGITTVVGVGRVLDRAMDLMMRSRSKPLPQSGLKSDMAGETNALGDCPRCGTGGLTFREDRRNRSSGGAGVTRIFLACATPECGYVES